MRLWEIPGWDKGVRVRRKKWEDRSYCSYDGDRMIFASDLRSDDWEPYEEPHTKRAVTLYRPIFLFDGEYQASTCWSSKKTRWTPNPHIVGWESKVMEVDE